MERFVRLWLMIVCCVFVGDCVEHAPQRHPVIRDASRVRVATRLSMPARPRVDASLPVIVGFHENWRDEVTCEYRKLFLPGSRQGWAQALDRCLVSDGHGHKRFIAPIREAARLTRGRYPEAFIAGLVIHESRCRANIVTRDHGTGYVQITPARGTNRVDRRWLERAKEFLGHDADWEHNPVDNIVLGLSALMEAELELGSRELGLAAYNAGIGGVRAAMSRLGWERGQPPLDIDRVAPLLPHRAHRWDARWYAAKVLATTVYANRVIHGCRHVNVINPRIFRLEHVPGASP